MDDIPDVEDELCDSPSEDEMCDEDQSDSDECAASPSDEVLSMSKQV